MINCKSKYLYSNLSGTLLQILNWTDVCSFWNQGHLLSVDNGLIIRPVDNANKQKMQMYFIFEKAFCKMGATECTFPLQDALPSSSEMGTREVFIIH